MFGPSGPCGREQARLAVGPGIVDEVFDLLADRHECSSPETRCITPARTKLSTTRFSPALSNWMVSLLPSTAVTLPLPNFWWNTRSPIAKAETVPVDLATSSPSMVSGRRGAAAAVDALPTLPLRGRGRRGAGRDRRRRIARHVVEAVVVEAVAPVLVPLRALPAGRAVARAEMRSSRRSARRRCCRSRMPPKPPFDSVTSTWASGNSSRKREGMFDVHSPCMRRLVAK